MNQKWRRTALVGTVTDYLFYTAGAAIYAFGFYYFIENNGISPGGITGIAAIGHFLFGVPTGFLYLLLNLPILVVGFLKIGGRFIIRTSVTTLLISFFMQTVPALLPAFSGDRLLAAVFGGCTCGFGMAVVMLRGATTGGIDIIAKLLRRRWPYLSMGRLILIMDGLIAVLAAVCYRNVQTLLYTAISLFTSSRVIDAILYGGDKGRLLLIVTAKQEEISHAILQRVHRGVTVLPAVGAYSGCERAVLLCALREPEVARAVAAVRELDQTAFTVITVTGGILGVGFEQNKD